MSEETGGAQKSHFMLILLSLIHFLPHATKFKYLGILFKSDGSSARMQITHTNPPEKPATDGNRMTETIDTSSFCSVTDIRRELWTQHLLIFQACPAGPQVKLSGGVIHPIWPSMLSWDPTGVAGKYWWGEGSLEYPA